MAKKTFKEDSEKSKRARISLECSLEIRKFIRVSAAKKDTSMNDYVVSLVLEKMQQDTEIANSTKP